MSSSEFVPVGIDEDVILVDLTNRTDPEVIVVTVSGCVRLLTLSSGKFRDIGKLSFEPFTKERRHPVFSAGLQLHSFRNYVAIVQVYGSHGTVFDLNDPAYLKKLDRQNYHPDVCKFPVAFVDRGDETWLIHATDWNRLDITRLEGDELLTDRVVSYETNENYFDYFHGGLAVSPDSKTFVSNGWHWHPYGQITFYSIDGFLKDFEICHVDLLLIDADDSEDAQLELGWDRPLCWIDNKTLGIGYNRGVGWYGQKTKFPSEILIYDVESNGIARRTEFDGFSAAIDNETIGELFFDRNNQNFICLDEKKGLLATDLDGHVVTCNQQLAGWKYNSSLRLFYRVDEKGRRVEMLDQEAAGV